MARKDRRKSQSKKSDHSQRMSHLKAKALTKVAQQAWASQLRYKSITLLTEAARRDPTNPDVLIPLATALGKQRHYEKAEGVLARLLEMAPRKASLYRRVAQAYAQIDRPERAVECYRRSLELNRDTAVTVPTLLELAGLYERRHQLDEAQAAVAEALQREPGQEDALLQQAVLLRRSGQATEAETALRALVPNNARTLNTRVQAGYELGQLLDDQQQYEPAFQALVAAKKLLRPYATGQQRDSKFMLDENQHLLDSLDRPCLEEWHKILEDGKQYRIALLTGHPRSGTTLVEQVLDGHDELRSADEFDVFAQWIYLPLVRKFRRGTPLRTMIDHVPARIRHQARATYWQQTEAIFDEPIGDRMLLDKNPGMTIVLPFLNWLFPEMKTLFAIRDPRDVVLSCFMQKVPLTPINSNWLSLAGTADYYARVMQMWLAARQLMISPWLEFRYEDVVADLEAESRRILEFLGLPWDERVLKFYEHAREKIVRSPTYKDVTQPIYQKSVGRWQHYARQFEPVLEKLQPFTKEFGYATE